MKYKQTISFISSTILLLSLQACSNPKDANKDNLKKALNQYFETHPSCFTLFDSKFPHYEGIGPRGESRSMSGYSQWYDAMAEAGLLTTQTIENKTSMGILGEYVEVRRKFELSEEGASAFDSQKRFCYGVREIIDITNFTEPTVSMKEGGTTSKVLYTYRIKDKKPWVDRLPLSKFSYSNGLTTINELLEDRPALSGTASGEASLVLTEKGWVDSRELSSSR